MYYTLRGKTNLQTSVTTVRAIELDPETFVNLLNHRFSTLGGYLGKLHALKTMKTDKVI